MGGKPLQNLSAATSHSEKDTSSIHLPTLSMRLHILYGLNLRYSCYNLRLRERQNLSAEGTAFIRLTHPENYGQAPQ